MNPAQWCLVLHLVIPLPNGMTTTVVDTAFIGSYAMAESIKNQIESSPVYLNASSKKKGFCELIQKNP